jgi:hypothetical protein
VFLCQIHGQPPSAATSTDVDDRISNVFSDSSTNTATNAVNHCAPDERSARADNILDRGNSITNTTSDTDPDLRNTVSDLFPDSDAYLRNAVSDAISYDTDANGLSNITSETASDVCADAFSNAIPDTCPNNPNT